MREDIINGSNSNFSMIPITYSKFMKSNNAYIGLTDMPDLFNIISINIYEYIITGD